MVNIALPSIMVEFQSPLAQTEWVVLIYLLTTSTTMLLWGHIADTIGRGRIYAGGFIIFGLGSFCCGEAATLPILLASRFLQAFGAAMMMANGPALLKETFPSQQLGRSLGYIGIATSLGLMTGPLLGGVVIQYATWRLMFLAPLPLYALAAGLAFIVLPQGPTPHSPGIFDWWGALWWALLLGTTAATLSLAATPNSPPQILIIGGLIALLTLGLFSRQEKYIQHDPTSQVSPILPADLFLTRAVTIAVLTAALSFLNLFAVLILTPFYLDLVLNLPGTSIGIVMLAIPLMVLLVAPLAGWLADFFDTRLITTAGLLISSGGMLLFSRLTATSTAWHVAVLLACFGAGQALFLSPNTTSALRHSERHHTGVVSALLATARTVGMLLGIALASLCFAKFFHHFSNGMDLRNYSPAQALAFVQAFSWSFRLFFTVALTTALLSLLRPPGIRGKR